MLGDVLLKLVSVLTVEDVKEMKRLGLGSEVKWVIELLDRTEVRWHAIGAVKYDIGFDAQAKLDELRVALNNN
jgi:hypothetical protein